MSMDTRTISYEAYLHHKLDEFRLNRFEQVGYYD